MKLSRAQQEALVDLDNCGVERAFLPLDFCRPATFEALVAKGLAVVEETVGGREIAALTDAGRAAARACSGVVSLRRRRGRPQPRRVPVDEIGAMVIPAVMLRRRFLR